MTTLKEIHVPDIGGASDVEIIEVLVSVGDQINVDDALITLESDKATMEVPASDAGVVKAVHMSVGDKVSEGSLIITLDVQSDKKTKTDPDDIAPEKLTQHTLTVPDIGGATDVEIIEVLVKAGDHVQVDDALITLESDKATMEMPSPYAGILQEVSVKVGDKVSEGTVIGSLEGVSLTRVTAPVQTQAAEKSAPQKTMPASRPVAVSELPPAGLKVHAGPAVRRIAREFGVDLMRVKSSGRKGRITVDDVRLYVRGELSKTQSGQVGSGLPEAPVVDFSKFGDVEELPLTRIQKLSAKGLHRNWLLVPHVTQFDDADITDLEAFRQKEKTKAAKQGFKLTPLVFIIKAVVKALQKFPRFNASLSPSGDHIFVKKYYHIGVAVDTPDGLVVPVVRDVDQKTVFELAKELGQISAKARDQQLKAQDMQGGCFTISSLGGIGGSAFTPIVNVPEVAILGVSRSAMKPVYQNGQFEPRLMLPLSLSYDHRVIDGALGARFITHLSKCLADVTLLGE